MDSKNTEQLTANKHVNGGLTLEGQIATKLQEAVQQQFIDNAYWNVHEKDDVDYESIYAELESGVSDEKPEFNNTNFWETPKDSMGQSMDQMMGDYIE